MWIRRQGEKQRKRLGRKLRGREGGEEKEDGGVPPMALRQDARRRSCPIGES